MRLTATTNVSVDGVIQGLGGSNEDRRGGFDRGGWAPPLVDAETADYLNQIYGGAAAFLFGRRTYEIFARSWGAIPEMATSTIGSALNGRHKYVASGTLTDPQWTGTTVLTGDIALAIRDLKAQQEGDLLVPGSGVLLRWLLANDLVDLLLRLQDRKSTRLNSSHSQISYAVFCLKKKNHTTSWRPLIPLGHGSWPAQPGGTAPVGSPSHCGHRPRPTWPAGHAMSPCHPPPFPRHT